MTELLHRFYFLKNFENFLKFLWLRIQPRSIYFLSWWLYLPFLLFYFLAILLLRESGYLSMSQIFFFQSLFCWFNLQPFNIFFYCSLPPPFFFICIAKTFQKSFFKLPVTMWFSTAGENYTVESFYVHDHKDQMSILHCLIVLVYFFSRPTFHDVLHFFTPFIHLNFSKKQIFIL